MVTHSSSLSWKISWREDPDRLQSMVSQRVGHDWVHCTPVLILIFLTVPKLTRLTTNIFAFVLVWSLSMSFILHFPIILRYILTQEFFSISTACVSPLLLTLWTRNRLKLQSLNALQKLLSGHCTQRNFTKKQVR